MQSAVSPVWNRQRPATPKPTELATICRLQVGDTADCKSALRRLNRLLAVALLFAPQAALACSVCFGKSDSKLTEGMHAGVLVLLLIVVAVLGGFGAFFIFLARKAAATAALEANSTESKA